MIYGNVVNDGLIDNLPAGACVEVPCVVDRTGVQPTRVGALPPQCAALNRTFLNVVELTVRGGAGGLARARLPRGDARPERVGVARPGRDPRVCDELIEAHGDALPALA